MVWLWLRVWRQNKWRDRCASGVRERSSERRASPLTFCDDNGEMVTVNCRISYRMAKRPAARRRRRREPRATRTSRVEGPADRQIPAMSRWDGLKSNADQSHASNQHRGHRPRPGSGGGGGRRQTQQQQQVTASWRRGAGPSGGGGDAEAKQAFDRDLRLLEQKLKKVQGAEHSEVGDAAAAVEEALLALQVQQRQKWLRFDPKRVGWSVESLFRAVQCMAALASVGAEPR